MTSSLENNSEVKPRHLDDKTALRDFYLPNRFSTNCVVESFNS